MRIFYLDYCRFFAIITVILTHVGHQSSFSYIIPRYLSDLGRFGVQLFFVISGITIFLSYNNLIKKSFNPIKAFYVKRFFRIVPLFVIIGIYYSFSQNIPFLKMMNPLSGLDPRYINSVAGGWSIWNEMYFYLLFPIYLYFRKTSKLTLLFCTILLIFSNIIHFRFFNIGSQLNMLDFDYLNIFSQFICFCVGIELMAKNYQRIAIFILSHFIIGIIIKYIFFKEFLFIVDFGSSYFTAIISLSCVAFICLVKYVSEKCIENHNNIILKFVASCGKVTYTSYLIHFIVLDIVFNFNLFDFGLEINLIIISGVTFLISIILKPYSEDFFSNLGYKIQKKYSK
jgi:exopolysaccharide production protein ExoZ